MKRRMFPWILIAALFLLLPAVGSARDHVGFCSCEVCEENHWAYCSLLGAGQGPCSSYLYLFCYPFGAVSADGGPIGVATWRPPTFADLLLEAAPASDDHAHEAIEVEPQEQAAPEMPDAVLRETVTATAVG